MHANHTAAVAELVLEDYGAGHAWLRPTQATPLDRYRLNPDRVVIVDLVDAEPTFIPRAELPRFVVRTTTEYIVFATSAEQALQWFDLQSDVDVDTEIVTFGHVEVVGQLEPEASAS
jgi:hypothetical protein